MKVQRWLAPQPTSVRAVRDALEELEGVVIDRRLDDLRLVVSELVTNAVNHAELGLNDLIGLGVAVEGSLIRVEATDPGVGFEKPSFSEPRDPQQQFGGMGLYLMDTLADSWGVDRKGNLNVTWLEMGNAL